MDKHRFFAHVPLTMLSQLMPKIAKIPIGWELLVDHEVLDASFREERERLAALLLEAGSPLRFHAPYSDIVPAGVDPEAVDLARRRIRETLELAPRFAVRDIVVHTAWHPAHTLEREAWLDRAARFWLDLDGLAADTGTRLALENVFDEDSGLLTDLLARLPAERFGVNFDIGHWHAYGHTELETWLNEFSKRLYSFHIHDNHGRCVFDFGQQGKADGAAIDRLEVGVAV